MRLLSSLLACASLFGPSCAFLVPSSFRVGAQRQSCEAQQTEPANHRASRTTSCRTSRQRRAGAAAAAAQSEATGNEYERIGVIICDHGSRREQANSMLLEVAERYRSFAGCDVVEAAHMEMAEPTIEQAFDRCVAAGAAKVVLHPFFLSPGRHVTSDIPSLMRAAAARHPDVAWVISEPLGLQKLMPRVMHAAVEESVTAGPWQNGGGEAEG